MLQSPTYRSLGRTRSSDLPSFAPPKLLRCYGDIKLLICYGDILGEIVGPFLADFDQHWASLVIFALNVGELSRNLGTSGQTSHMFGRCRPNLVRLRSQLPWILPILGDFGGEWRNIDQLGPTLGDVDPCGPEFDHIRPGIV